MGQVVTSETTLPAKTPGLEDYEKGLRELQQGNYAEAVRLFKKAVDEEDYEKARIELGMMYRDGVGVEKNTEEAIRMFSTQRDDGVGENQLGWMFLKGLGVEKNPEKAAELFKEAKEKDNFDAQSHLGFLYITGVGVEIDSEEGKRLLLEASKNSHEAEAYLGLMYMEGLGVPRNYSIAIEYLRKATDAGHLDAHIYLAELYLQGKGTDRQPFAAAKLLLRAAEKGHARAQCYIGLMYRDGIGVAENQKNAQKWLKASSDKNDTLGMYSWGKYLLDSNNMSWEWTDVVDLLTKAASKGNMDGDLFDDLYMDGLSRVFRLEN